MMVIESRLTTKKIILVVSTCILAISTIMPLAGLQSSVLSLSYSHHEPSVQVHVSEETSSYEACTSVIVTGRASENGRAILMKNRDSSEIYNRPVYYPATATAYAFVAVNSMWMGINERGLAVMNTAMLALAESPNAGEYNGLLNRLVLELCENVSHVEHMLADPESPIGPAARTSELAVATCLGVVDRFGLGAFFEVSNSMYAVEYVEEGYQSRANHPRIFPGLASGPSGRDQYALDALDDIFAEKGSISWTDVAQEVSRYVHDKELGSTDFSITGEICNDYTVSAMVAVSGDSRYDGKLNVMWCEYGRVPLVGVFFPSMAFAGNPPFALETISEMTELRREYAESNVNNYYTPSSVREIQEYAFAAEDYAANEYDYLLTSIPTGLSEGDLEETLSEFIDLNVRVIADMYINETSVIPPYAPKHASSTTTSTTQTSTTTQSTTTTTTTTTSTTTEEIDIHTPIPMTLGLGVTSGAVVLVLITIWRRREQ